MIFVTSHQIIKHLWPGTHQAWCLHHGARDMLQGHGQPTLIDVESEGWPGCSDKDITIRLLGRHSCRPVRMDPVVCWHPYGVCRATLVRFRDGSALFQQDNGPWLRAKLLSEVWRAKTRSLRCWLRLKIQQISIHSSICGIFWTNKMDPWRY